MTQAPMRWLGEHVQPISTFESDAEADDLAGFADGSTGATIVALGASTRATHELSAVAHRLVRLLVERHGFRALALEGDESSSAELDTYVRTGAGDPMSLLAKARPFWRTKEILDLVRWLRAYNQTHPNDQVHVVHPPGAGTEAAQITGADGMERIESALADNTLRWHEQTGHKIVYWGGTAHTHVRPPGDPRHPTGGTIMRERLGAGYLSVGLTFHRGTEPGGVPAPPADFADAVLGEIGVPAYFLDLRTEAPEPVRAWLNSPTKTRFIGPFYDPDVWLGDGALTDWFDVLVHVDATTPVRPLD